MSSSPKIVDPGGMQVSSSTPACLPDLRSWRSRRGHLHATYQRPTLLMFNIELIGPNNPLPEFFVGPGRWARIKIGGHSERLCVPTVFWSPDQYQDHWASSLSHLKKHGRSIFVVSIVAPICDDQLLHCWAVSSQPSICAQEWIIDTEDYTGELALNQLTEKFMPDDQSIDELFSHGSVFK